MTDPLLIVEHLKSAASALVNEIDRSAASGLITHEVTILAGKLQQALCFRCEDLIAVPAIEWLRIVNGGQMSEGHREMVKAMHDGRHYEPAPNQPATHGEPL